MDILRHCLPSSVQRFLEELPESLDETYKRILKEIKKPNRDHARRLLQCLVVAIRPLRVEELAEVLAINFDDASGIPKLNLSWRWENQEQALLTSCSSLITIVDTGYSRVVQFSHFSVKEFLTSTRLSTSSQDVSLYHVVHKPAHTIMAQACLSTLLQLDNLIEGSSVVELFPLAEYTGGHWLHHAQFEDVASHIKGMEDLFDLDKPYFAPWYQFFDIDGFGTRAFSQLIDLASPKSNAGTPLYCAALFGFSTLVEHLAVKYPEHVDAIGGCYGTPAVAALAGRHFQLAQVLYRNGSSVDPRCRDGFSPLQSAAIYGDDLEMVRVLLDYGVDVNAQNDRGYTALLYASYTPFNSDDPEVLGLLLDHHADLNVKTNDGLTPLHLALGTRSIKKARLLVERGASVEVQDKDGRTPLDVASEEHRDEIIALLLEHRTK